MPSNSKKKRSQPQPTAEHQRLKADRDRKANWKRWGSYLSERQWATVREDYSHNGECWNYFPHDHARSRSYRWGEDGLLGFSDRECRLCFCVALWNGKDGILKERLFGLTGSEGNHGEDVKELYYYLDATPTQSYSKALYKYPQSAFPYSDLLKGARSRGLDEPEFELVDTGAFNEDRYFDVFAEYVKTNPDHILIRLTLANRSEEAATLHVLPQLWFRNEWSWSPTHSEPKPELRLASNCSIDSTHSTLGQFTCHFGSSSDGTQPQPLFTENESNTQLLWGVPSAQKYVKDAFHRLLINGEQDAVNPAQTGTKAALHYTLHIPAGKEVTIDLQLASSNFRPLTPTKFSASFANAKSEADDYYAHIIPSYSTPEEANILRQGYAGLVWSKQFYHYVVEKWLDGDDPKSRPPTQRLSGRNAEWAHLYSRDIISMPDKWEYPWFAAWDLAFHMIPFAKIDPDFSKQQLILFLREWYMHPNGQLPAYEFAFGDVNPPVHAWAAWRVYKIANPAGQRDRKFLERVFQKLLLNFTWWVNRKDAEGKNLFSGGFLGLDNIGVFDRGQPIPGGGHLRQADGTAWMAFYASSMLAMALELAIEPDGNVNVAYEDMASKFFEHYIQIVDAMNTAGGMGLWDEADGFYYDQIDYGSHSTQLKIRSLVGLMPLIASLVLDQDVIQKLPGFSKRFDWFNQHRPDLARHIGQCTGQCTLGRRKVLLTVPSEQQLVKLVGHLINEDEFLSAHGLRSVSRYHEKNPYIFSAGGQEMRLDYAPGESKSYLFGGNSNWRGPIWFPVAYLIVEALERYAHFYGDSITIETRTVPSGRVTLNEAAQLIANRMAGIFLPDNTGHRPVHGFDPRYQNNPHFKDLVLFYEYFHGDSGRGVGASHQTGWTALAIRFLEDLGWQRHHANQPT